MSKGAVGLLKHMERATTYDFSPRRKMDWFGLSIIVVVTIILAIVIEQLAFTVTTRLKVSGYVGFKHPRPELLTIGPPSWDTLHYLSFDKHGHIITGATYELAEVIANLEGWHNPESNPVKWHNPGALVYAGQAHAHKGPKGYAIFDEDGYGWKELLNQINILLYERHLNIWEVCRGWTGTNDDVYTRACMHGWQDYTRTQERQEQDWETVPRGPVKRSIDPK
jgi:hypothetical protein